MARLYQKIDGEAVPLGGGGGSSVDIDNITITKNSSSNKIQVADAITSKVNELNNTASDAGKILTANGDGTASWENGYVEGFYGTTDVWNALSYAQKKEWVQKNPKVTFTDDYVSNIKQTVSDCMSSIDENDVVSANALKELISYSTTEKLVGKWTDGRDVWAKTYHFVINGVVDSGSTYKHIIDANFGTNGEEFINATGKIIKLNDANKPIFGVPYMYRSDFFCSFGTDATNGLKLIYQGDFNGRTADVTVEYVYTEST